MSHRSPVHLYVHVPFCRRRCGYCNFTVIADRLDLTGRYLRAIEQEASRTESDPQPLQTVFIGGGTPTQLTRPELQKLMDCLRRHYRFADDIEITIEANPEDVDDASITHWHHLGINRVSFGVQSFDDRKLQRLDRGHDGRQAAIAIRRVSDVIPNVSADLIFATPGESVSAWRTDLDRALALPIVHLSTYALTYEKGTRFWSLRHQQAIREVDETTDIRMYRSAIRSASAAGLQHYEISSFARPNYRCRHNLAYWLGRPWIALGPGAAGFGRGVRTLNHRSVTTYLRRIECGQSPIVETDRIARWDYAAERMAFGIRMIDGLDLGTVQCETGVDVSGFRTATEQNLADGWVTCSADHLQLTRRGILFADRVAARYLEVMPPGSGME